MPPAAIYPGEELRVAAGFPVLSQFRKGDPGQPLVVFVTGGGVLARIAYGHEGARPAGFLAQLISDARFLSDYAGDFPVNLAATALRYRAGRFVMDADADCADTGVWDYAGFPALAMLTHNSAVDARHALSDRANWSLHIVQSLGARRLWAARDDLAKLPVDRFAQLSEIVAAAPERLSARVPDTHLFFVGEGGARATVQALDELRSRERELSATLDRLLGRTAS